MKATVDSNVLITALKPFHGLKTGAGKNLVEIIAHDNSLELIGAISSTTTPNGFIYAAIPATVEETGKATVNVKKLKEFMTVASDTVTFQREKQTLHFMPAPGYDYTLDTAVMIESPAKHDPHFASLIDGKDFCNAFKKINYKSRYDNDLARIVNINITGELVKMQYTDKAFLGKSALAVDKNGSDLNVNIDVEVIRTIYEIKPLAVGIGIDDAGKIHFSAGDYTVIAAPDTVTYPDTSKLLAERESDTALVDAAEWKKAIQLIGILEPEKVFIDFQDGQITLSCKSYYGKGITSIDATVYSNTRIVMDCRILKASFAGIGNGEIYLNADSMLTACDNDGTDLVITSRRQTFALGEDYIFSEGSNVITDFTLIKREGDRAIFESDSACKKLDCTITTVNGIEIARCENWTAAAA